MHHINRSPKPAKCSKAKQAHVFSDLRKVPSDESNDMLLVFFVEKQMTPLRSSASYSRAWKREKLRRKQNLMYADLGTPADIALVKVESTIYKEVNPQITATLS